MDLLTVNTQLLGRALEILPQWLPDGNRQGQEWVGSQIKGFEQCLSIPTGKIAVNLVTGVWRDLTGGRTGDGLVALWEYISGDKPHYAYKVLAITYFDVKYQSDSIEVKARAGVKVDSTSVNVGLGVEVNIPDDEEAGSLEKYELDWNRLGLARTKQGVIANMDNALRVLEEHPDFKGLVWYDEFHNKIFTEMNLETWERERRREWGKLESLHLTRYMNKYLGISKMLSPMVDDAVYQYAFRDKRNEPRDWMDTLVWDKQARLEAFFPHYFGAEFSAYSALVSKNFWIGMVARIYNPGCQLDTMVILEGDQGSFKSSALRLLGGSWHLECQDNIKDKDFNIGLLGRSLVIINEWDKFRDHEAALLKDIISTPSDSFRPLYNKNHIDHPRTCIFIATTNKEEYLRDATGGRRYWPIKTNVILKDDITRDREQLYAEAVVRFKAGEHWWDATQDMIEEAEHRRVRDPWEDIMAPWLVGREYATIPDILLGPVKQAETHINLDQRNARRVGECLRALGWAGKNERIDGATLRIYRKKPALVAAELAMAVVTGE